MRLAILLIHTEHKFSRHYRAAVFNRIFAEELAACGLLEGASANIVAVQWHERTKTNPDWIDICRPGAGAADAPARDAMRQRIQQAMASDNGTNGAMSGGRVGENLTVKRATSIPATPRARRDDTGREAAATSRSQK